MKMVFTRQESEAMYKELIVLRAIMEKNNKFKQAMKNNIIEYSLRAPHGNKLKMRIKKK